MVRINNFIYSMNAITNENDSNIFGVINALNPDYLPGAFSFSVFFSVLGLEDGDHRVLMKFVSPSGKDLLNVNGIIPYKYNNEQGIPSEYSGLNISSSWQNVLLEESGIYRTDVYIDDQKCGSYEIFAEGKNKVKG